MRIPAAGFSTWRIGLRPARCSPGWRKRFPDVAVVDLGGGIGVPDQLGSSEIDLAALDRGVAELLKDFPHIEFWMEPGRFLVARAGVLVALVTQLKGKGDVHYVGDRDRHEFLDPPGALRRASRHPQSYPPR